MRGKGNHDYRAFRILRVCQVMRAVVLPLARAQRYNSSNLRQLQFGWLVESPGEENSLAQDCLLLFSSHFALLCCRAQAPEPAQNPKDYTAHVVGYAHMDMAWLWRWEESIHDVMYNTFTNQIRLMNQNPDYTFSQDQAVVLDSMEHYYPDVFKGLQEKARLAILFRRLPAGCRWMRTSAMASRWCGSSSTARSTARRSSATISASPGSRMSSAIRRPCRRLQEGRD